MLAGYPTHFTRLLFEVMDRAHDIAQGHIFDMRDIREPFFCSCYIGDCDTRGSNAIFASKDIDKGELICMVPLILVPSAIDSVRIKTNRNQLLDVTHEHLCYYSERFLTFSYVDMFTNHTCYPHNNSRPIDCTVFPDSSCIGEGAIATQDIAKGQEVTVDYGTFEYEDDHVTFVCACGTPQCVKEYRGLKYYTEARQDGLMLERQVSPGIMAELYLEASESRRLDIDKQFLPLLSEEQLFIFYHSLCTLADEADDEDE
jgi:hypothetical protein